VGQMGHCKGRGLYLFYGKGNENQLGTGFIVQLRMASAVQRVEFVNDRISYILRGRGCNIIVLKLHTPSEEKSDFSKVSFMDKESKFLNHFLKYHMKILLGDSNAKLGRENIFKPTIGNMSLH